MRGDGVVEYCAGEHRGGREGQTWQQIADGPTTDPAEDKKAERGGDASALLVPSAPAFGKEGRNPQTWRYRHIVLRLIGGAQRLPLSGILRIPLPLGGMPGEIGVDDFGTPGREATISARL